MGSMELLSLVFLMSLMSLSYYFEVEEEIIPEKPCIQYDLTPSFDLAPSKVEKEMKKAFWMWGNVSKPERRQQLYILKTFDEFCTMHNESWMLYSGSLLGM